jgi:hypothetical protein
MRVDYHKVFPSGMRAMAELERAVHSATLEPELLELVRVRAEFSPEEIAGLTFAIVAINGWNRLAVGLRSDVLRLDGLDLPDGAGPGSASGSA